MTYDSTTTPSPLQLNSPAVAAVFDLLINGTGLADGDGAFLDGEWINGVTTNKSGDGTPGGDFSFRVFFLPGDTLDESAGNGTRTVNTNDSQVVRDRQNGFVVTGVGAVGFDPRADLDGSGFINSSDSQLFAIVKRESSSASWRERHQKSSRSVDITATRALRRSMPVDYQLDQFRLVRIDRRHGHPGLLGCFRRWRGDALRCVTGNQRVEFAPR